MFNEVRIFHVIVKENATPVTAEVIAQKLKGIGQEITVFDKTVPPHPGVIEDNVTDKQFEEATKWLKTGDLPDGSSLEKNLKGQKELLLPHTHTTPKGNSQ